MDEFIDPPFAFNNLDKFHIRNAIFEFLKINTPQLKGSLLDVGCGRMPYKKFILDNSEISEYIGLDIEDARVYDAAVKPDVRWDGVVMPFDREVFDVVLATEVLEHCPDPSTVLHGIYRVMRSEGHFLFTVPFLWNLHEIPNDEYRYTPFALKRLLQEAGFVDIHIEAHGGWHASLAQMIGLWVRRAPMTRHRRRLLSWLLLPIVRLLLRKDKLYDKSFKKPIMLTGLTGTAKKA